MWRGDAHLNCRIEFQFLICAQATTSIPNLPNIRNRCMEDKKQAEAQVRLGWTPRFACELRSSEQELKSEGTRTVPLV